MEFDGMIDLFRQESEENMQSMDKYLLELESDPKNMGVINELFRAAHTLKGMSATMGFDVMASLTHEMEDLMGKLREKELIATAEIVDVLLDGNDLLGQIIEEYGEKGKTSVEIEGFVGRLHEALKSDSKESSVVNVDKVQEVDVEENSRDYFHIELVMKDDAQMKAARMYIVTTQLADRGVIVSTSPKLEFLEGADDKTYNGILSLVYDTQMSNEELEDYILSLNNFHSIDIKPPGLSGDNSDVKGVTSGIVPDARPSLDEDDDSFVMDDSYRSDVEIVNNSSENIVAQGKTVRVESNKVDQLINLIGELVIEKNKLELLGAKSKDDELRESVERMDNSINYLQELVMKVRMVPISNTFRVFPKLIRKTARDLKKDVKFVIEGGDTELDRTIVEQIKDPLLHMLRNSLDHGLESPVEREKAGKDRKGTIKLSAGYEGNQVVIKIEDDGAGIDADAVAKKAISKGLTTEERVAKMDYNEKASLVTKAGLSTASEVTDLSGRGVGLDAVKTYIEELSGSVHIETKPGEGTTMMLYVPLTLAIIKAMMVKVRQEEYAVPLSSVETILSVKEADITWSDNKQVVMYKDEPLSLINMASVVGLEANGLNPDGYILLIKRSGRIKGLVVDEIIGQQEIVIKSLGKHLTQVKAFAGATILGSGSIALIIDTNSTF